MSVSSFVGSSFVAPFVGAWIEIIIVNSTQSYLTLSLPSWERGLKLKHLHWLLVENMSLPSRERGLKLCSISVFQYAVWSLPSRERGLKFYILCNGFRTFQLLPSRERRLKSPIVLFAKGIWEHGLKF